MTTTPQQEDTPDILEVAIIGTGPSLSAARVAQISRRYGGSSSSRVVAVSDAYKDCKHIDALVSADVRWWIYHKPEVDCPRFMGNHKPSPVKGYTLPQACSTIDGHPIPSGTCSAALAIYLAAHIYNPKRIILFGYDMKPTLAGKEHYFGSHPDPLTDTPESSFFYQRRQVFDAVRFAAMRLSGVYCATPGSYLMESEQNNGNKLRGP